MSLPVPSDPFFASAFFDAPGLLAIRFSRTESSRPAASFAAYRRPDTPPGISISSMIKVAGVGLVVAWFAVPMLTGNAAAGTSSSGKPPVISSPTTRDSAESSTWANSLEHLADDLSPTRADLKPWMVRSLLDVPRELARSGSATGGATGGWLKPRCSPADRAAYAQGQRLAHTLKEIGADRQLAVILDLPGPTAIAVATALARNFDPVFTFENLPHPAGVVPSAQTLAAAVYWRPQLVAAREARKAAAVAAASAAGTAEESLPPVFVLEGDRLAAYANEVERFDNRSQVRLPDAAALRALGVTRVLYVRQRRGEVAEADDLNATFLALAAGDINVKHLALDTLDRSEDQVEKDQVEKDQVEKSPAPSSAAQSSTNSSAWFWHQYAWYRPVGRQWTDPSDPDARYRTSLRPTQFSGTSGTPRYDGGNAHRYDIFRRLSPPPPVSSSSGSTSGSKSGSWGRSSSHSSSG